MEREFRDVVWLNQSAHLNGQTSRAAPYVGAILRHFDLGKKNHTVKRSNRPKSTRESCTLVSVTHVKYIDVARSPKQYQMLA